MLQVDHAALEFHVAPPVSEWITDPNEEELHENVTSGLGLLSAAEEDLLGYTPTGLEREVFNLVNQERARGFRCPDGTYFYPNTRPLQWDCRLFRAARKWSVRMASENFIAHRKGGSTSCQRTAAEGYPSQRGCGENIAGGSRTARGAVEQWKKSNGHCKSMFEPKFTKSGVGFANNPRSQYRDYITNSFGDDSCSPDESCQGGYPAPTPAPGCGDTDINCEYYRDQGQCSVSPNVKSACKDTCRIGNCRPCSGSPAPGPTPPAGPAPGGACRDSDPNCRLYASKGYCSGDRIKGLCAQSCGCCDRDPNCRLYAGKGYCSGDRIKQLCARSCGVCR